MGIPFKVIFQQAFNRSLAPHALQDRQQQFFTISRIAAPYRSHSGSKGFAPSWQVVVVVLHLRAYRVAQTLRGLPSTVTEADTSPTCTV